MLCGILSFLIAAGSVAPSAEKLGFGSVTAYAEDSSESTGSDSAGGTEGGSEGGGTSTVDKTALEDAIETVTALLAEIESGSENSWLRSIYIHAFRFRPSLLCGIGLIQKCHGLPFRILIKVILGVLKAVKIVIVIVVKILCPIEIRNVVFVALFFLFLVVLVIIMFNVV